MSIHYELGGLIASAWPEGHENMRISWDLLSGDVFFAHNGRRIASDVTKVAGFKRAVVRLFDEVFAE